MKFGTWLLAGLVGLLGLSLGVRVSAQGEKMSVKEIMARVNKGTSALFPTIRKGLNADAPDWTALDKQTKELAVLTEALTKKDPPRGGKDTWVKFTKAYVADTKALAEAAQKKDKDGMVGVFVRINKACTACHRLHRPPQ